MSFQLEKPEVDFPEGNPPADLEIVDIWEGQGEEAKPGQQVSVASSRAGTSASRA